MRCDINTQSIFPFSAAPFQCRQLLAHGVLLAALLFLSSHSVAHPLSVSECKEASDFIKNAALARDNGIPESIFIDKIRDDIEIIRAYPPQLRWFVRDDDDATLLVSAAMDVFHHPKAARVHQFDFFNACIAAAKATSNTRKISM